MNKILLASLLLFIGTFQAHAEILNNIANIINNNQGKKFACDSNSYIFTSDQTANYTKAIGIDMVNETITTLKDSFASSHINAIGFNVKDGYIYGWEYREGSNYQKPYAPQLVRIDADFNLYDVALTGTLPATRFYLGAISKDGIFYMANRHQPENNSYLQEIQQIDLNTKKVLTKITLKQQDIYSADFAVNPKDDMLYTVNAINNQLVKIDPTDGTVTELGDTGIRDPYSVGSGKNMSMVYPAYSVYNYFDKYGNFYFQVNGDEVYKIDISNTWRSKDNQKARASKYKDVGGIQSGDGARCALAAIEEIKEPIAQPFVCNDAGTLVSYVTSGSAESGVSQFKAISLEDGHSISDVNLSENTTGVNSIGYNVKDNFVWGYNIPSRKVVRIDANHHVKYYEMDNEPDIGGHYYNALDIDQNAIMYMKADSSASRLDRVRLEDKSTLAVLSSINLSEDMYTADFAFNPLDHKIYYVDSKDGWLKRIDINGNDGVITKVDELEVVYTVIATFDKYGNFYYNHGTNINKVIFNNQGKISSVIKNFSSVSRLTQGDGTRCVNAEVPDPKIALKKFTCSADAYLFTGTKDDEKYNLELTDVFTIDLANGKSLPVKEALAYQVNATGYNVKDDLIWGYDISKNSVIRIDANYHVDSYDVARLPKQIYYAGDVAPDGNLYLKAHDNNTLYKVDLNSGIPNLDKNITLYDPTQKQSLFNFGDFAFNPTDNMLYGINEQEQQHLCRIDVETGIVEDLGDVNLTEDVKFHTFVFDKRGNLYFYGKSGNIFKIDLSPDAKVPYTASPFNTTTNHSSGGDGARCPNAEVNVIPKISIGDASMVEGDEGTKNIVFTVTSDTDIPERYKEGLKLSYRLSDGTAKVGEDYNQFQGSFFMTGKSYSVSLPIIKGDKKVEADEDFFIHFTAPIEKESATFVNDTAKGTIIDDDRPEKGTCYATTDNYNKMFIYDDLNETDGLAYPQELNLTEIIDGKSSFAVLDGEGGAYRALDGYMYIFAYSTTADDMDLKKINIQTGEVTMAKKGLLPEHVDAVEFFYDEERKTDVMYVADKHAGKFYTIDTTTWEKTTKNIVDKDGEKVKIGSLAIDPYSGKIYGVRDYGGWTGKENTNPILYSLAITNANVIATQLATLPKIDAEGLAFANDGKLYLETEELGSDEDEHKIYRLDLQTYTLTKVAHTGTKDAKPINDDNHKYVDIETLSCDGGKSQVPPIFTITQQEVTIKEGNTNGIDGTNAEDINITIRASKLLDEDTIFTIIQSEATAKLTDYKTFVPNTFTMLKGTDSITFSKHSVIADQEVEGDEYFTCELRPSFGKFKDEVNSIKVTIIDDDYHTLDAFDMDKDSHHSVIKTKKVNNAFLLKIAAIDIGTKDVKGFDGFEDILVRIVPSEACVSHVSDIPSPDVGFELLRDDVLGDGTILQPFIISGAIKNAKVQFWWKNSAGDLKTTCSTDTFAVRPDKYTLSIPKLVAGKPFDINITAVDVYGHPVTNYTESSNVYTLDINETEVINHNPRCKLGAVTEIGRTSFANGLSTVRLEYSEIGKLQFQVSEIEDMATEYAYNDATDGSDRSRFISKSPLTTQGISASKLITSYSFTTQNEINAYTYYSGNAKEMGAMIDVNISVQNEDGEVLENFTDGCYAEDVNISISYIRNGEASSVVDFNVTDVALSGGNLIKYQVNDSNFTDGNASRRVYMNFGRDTMNMKKPLKVRLTTTQAELTDVPDAIPNINKTISFLYARAHVQNDITVVGKELNATVDYEVYLPSGNGTGFGLAASLAKSKDDLRWSVLPTGDANLSFSSATLVYPDSEVSVTKVSDELITIKTTKTPKKNRISYKAPSYLMHSDTDPNAVSDSFASSLQSDSNQWSGKGNRGKVFDDTASREIKRRMEW